MWMLCSTPTILSLFLQGSVVKPKVWTALTAWIWRASHFWLSRYTWDGTSEKKKNKQKPPQPEFLIFLYRHCFHMCIPAFYNFYFTLKLARNKAKVFPPMTVIRNFPEESKWEFFLQAYHPNLQGSPVKDLSFL